MLPDDKLTFAAMHRDRELWNCDQSLEFESMLRGETMKGAVSATRQRLEDLLRALVIEVGKDRPEVEAARPAVDRPQISVLLKLCKKYRLVEAGALDTMNLVNDVATEFAHSPVTSALEPKIDMIFQKLRDATKMPMGGGVEDDIAVLVAAMQICVGGIREWRTM
jgi:hypothetical protein